MTNQQQNNALLTIDFLHFRKESAGSTDPRTCQKYAEKQGYLEEQPCNPTTNPITGDERQEMSLDDMLLMVIELWPLLREAQRKMVMTIIRQ